MSQLHTIKNAERSNQNIKSALSLGLGWANLYVIVIYKLTMKLLFFNIVLFIGGNNFWINIYYITFRYG